MNQNFFTFTPTFKLLISGNYKPHMRPDTAMRRRFQLIPFKTAIPKGEQDPKLGAKLEKEWPGILGWMIAGAVEWQRVGLSPPSAVLDATNEYMEEEAEDVLSAWMHERCELDPKAETAIGDLYRSYKIYAEQAGESVMTNAMLGKELKRLEFNSRRTERARLVVGLKLASPAEPPRPPASFPRSSSPPPLPGIPSAWVAGAAALVTIPASAPRCRCRTGLSAARDRVQSNESSFIASDT